MGPWIGKSVVLMALGLASAAAQNVAPLRTVERAVHPGAVGAGVKPPAPQAVQVPEDVPIAPMSEEELPARAPRVSYRDRQLVVDSDNAALSEVLTAICKAMGVQLDLPPNLDSERVALHLKGPARQVIATLLDDGKFGYVILSSPQDPAEVQRLVLTAQSADKAQPAPVAKGRMATVVQTEPGPTPELGPAASDNAGKSEQTPPAAEAAPSPQQQQEAARAAAYADATEAQQQGKPTNDILQDLYRKRQQINQAQNPPQKTQQEQ